MNAPAGSLNLEALFAPVASHDVLGLAVSGGADSLALMILAAHWAQSFSKPKRLIVYTLDHGLRAEAKAETDYVCACAAQLGLEARVLHWTGEKSSTGIQAAARAARYRLMGATMAEDGAPLLLTAHHMQDQAETVLMRLAHGSGLGGLSGMRAFSRVEDVALFRPLLDLTRSDLRAIVAALGWVPVDDPSNSDIAYERVRWRNMAGTLAEQGLDAQALSRFARRAARADAALTQMAAERFDALAQVDALGVVRLDRAGWHAQTDEIGIRLVQMALRIAGGDVRPFGLSQIEKLVDDLSAAAPFATSTLMGCMVALRPDQIEFSREAARVEQACVTLLPGQKLTWDHRFVITNQMEQPVEIMPGVRLTKDAAAGFLGHDNFAARHVHGAPVVLSAAGEIIAMGANSHQEMISVAFIGADAVHKPQNLPFDTE